MDIQKKADEIAGRESSTGIDRDIISDKTKRGNGADMAEIIRRYIEEKAREESTSGQEPGKVTTDYICVKLRDTKR